MLPCSGLYKKSNQTKQIAGGMDADMQIPVSQSTNTYPLQNFTLLPCFGLYAIYMENQSNTNMENQISCCWSKNKSKCRRSHLRFKFKLRHSLTSNGVIWLGLNSQPTQNTSIAAWMDAQTSHDSLAVIFLWKERDFSKMSMLQIYFLKNISTKSMHLFSEEDFY